MSLYWAVIGFEGLPASGVLACFGGHDFLMYPLLSIFQFFMLHEFGSVWSKLASPTRFLVFSSLRPRNQQSVRALYHSLPKHAHLFVTFTNRSISLCQSMTSPAGPYTRKYALSSCIATLCLFYIIFQSKISLSLIPVKYSERLNQEHNSPASYRTCVELILATSRRICETEDVLSV